MITMRLCAEKDVPQCMSFIREARLHQEAQGFTQWDADYPSAALLLEDVALARGYVIESDGIPVGYVCIDFGGEPIYDSINGAWQTNQPYAVMHRLALGDAARGKGASADIFRLTMEMSLARSIRAIRVDTHPANLKMQHIVLREGFVLCGEVIYPEGGMRLAYERDF